MPLAIIYILLLDIYRIILECSNILGLKKIGLGIFGGYLRRSIISYLKLE